MRSLPSAPVVLIRDYMRQIGYTRRLIPPTNHPLGLTVVEFTLRRSGISALFGL